jgi:hypothetical protein
VYVAFAQVSGGSPLVVIAKSTDGGVTWPELVSLQLNTALPQLAVNTAGELSILYTEFKDGLLRTHFDIVAAGDFLGNFGSRADYVLAQFPDGIPAPRGAPYIGDFEDLIAIDGDFYGTFSASNDPKLFDFPQGVFYDRLLNGDTGPGPHRLLLQDTTLFDNIAISIDPFFFTTAVPEPLSWPLLVLGFVVSTALRGRFRAC